MKLGLLQCGAIPPEVARDHGDYPALYAHLLGPGFDWTTYRADQGTFPARPAEREGWLISGSACGAYEDHDWIAPLEDLIRAIAAANIPLVGICFGHQIIAQALGGTVEKSRLGWTIGRTAYEWDGAQTHLFAWHQDQVTDPPPQARVTMTSDRAPNAGLTLGRILTLQPHPEFDAPFIAALADHRAGTVPGDILDTARTTRHDAVDNAATGTRLAAHFRQDTR